VALTEDEELELLELEEEELKLKIASGEQKAQAASPVNPLERPGMKYTPDTSAGEGFGKSLLDSFGPIAQKGAQLGAELFETAPREGDDTPVYETITYISPLDRSKRVTEQNVTASRMTELAKTGAEILSQTPSLQFRSAQRSAQDSWNQDVEQADANSPTASILGRTVGTVAQGAAMGKLPTSTQSLMGAAQGVATGETPVEQLAGGAFGAAAPYVGKGLFSGKDPQASLNKRNIETMLDIPKPERDRLLQEYGEEGLYAIGEELRKRGITNRWTSASDLAKAITEAKEEVGGQIGAKVNAMQLDTKAKVMEALMDKLRGTGKKTFEPLTPDDMYSVLGDAVTKGGTQLDSGGVYNTALSKLKQIFESPVNKFGRTLDAQDVHQLQSTIARSAKSFEPGVQDEAAKAMHRISAGLRGKLREVDPSLLPLQKAYGILSTSQKGANNAVQSDFAKVKAFTTINKLLQSTALSPQVQGLINGLLEVPTMAQGSALGQVIQKGGQLVQQENKTRTTDPDYIQSFATRYAANSPDPKLRNELSSAIAKGKNSLKALHYIKMQRDPAYSKAFMESEEAKRE